MLKVCLVGYKGYWGKYLERVLKVIPNVEITAFVDKTEKTQMPFANSLQDALTMTEFESVIIATPPSSHYEIAHQSICAGKHVLIEKPMTTCSKDAHKLNQLAKEHNVKIGVDHTFLFSNHIRLIKKIITDGKIGQMQRIISNRFNLGKFQDLGVIFDLAPHDIAMTNYLMDSKPKVKTVEFLRHNNVIDTAQISMIYGDIHYSLNLSWLFPKKVRTTVIIGTEGMIEYDMLSDRPLKIYDKRADKSEVDWVHSFNWVSEYHGDAREPLQVLIEEWRDYCLNNKEFCSTGELGATVVECIEEILQSENKIRM